MIPGTKKQKSTKKETGAILTLVLVFAGIFVMIFSGLVGYIFLQYQQSKQKVASEQALAIAEAGANYSRWHLAHAPNDYSFSGTYDYRDPETDVVGKYSLDISEPAACSTITTNKATGWSLDYPDVKRAVMIRFGRPSLAQYAFLTNSDVWIGENEQVRGPLHSNGGIRMDGTQNALSTSAKETYRCQPIHGCSPAQTKPGIWGSGAGGTNGLWTFPVPAIDFNSLTVDLAQLKTQAQNGGYYFGPSGAFGYHVQFKNDGSFNLYKVTKLQPAVDGWDTQGVKHTESNDIGNGNAETLVGSYPLTAGGGCDARSLIFVEDLRVWVDGVLRQKATVAAAQFPDNPTTNSTIIINGNLMRADPTATMVALIAQKNILVPLKSPNVLEIQAVMIAQKGAVQRYYYKNQGPDTIKNRIMVRGSIISNNIWTWSWVDNNNNVISGYQTTESYYEPALIYAPPPFFPSSGVQQFISWEEISP
jgi:hypothetical protein